jgi:hypothetical protein
VKPEYLKHPFDPFREVKSKVQNRKDIICSIGDIDGIGDNYL